MVDYCLPIIRPTRKQVLHLIKRHQGEYRYFEIWLDYVRDLTPAFPAEAAAAAGDDRAIFLFRRQNLEQIELPFERRCELIKNHSPHAYLDLDVSTQQDEIEFIRLNGLKPNLILSYHNYKFTPESNELRKLVDGMAKRGASICKIATVCRTERDALRLLELLLETREKGYRCLILGMGDHGKLTRIVGTMWGNEFIFAPIKTGEESAPGQLTRRQIETIIQELQP